MIRSIYAVVLLAVTLLPAPLSAGTAGCSTESAPLTRIYFSNGIRTDLAGARSSRNLLLAAYKDRLESLYPDERFEFIVAYNHSFGMRADLLEVARQKIEEAGQQDRITAEQALRIIEQGSQVEFSDPLLQAIVDVYLEAMRIRYFEISTAENHVQKYRSDLLEGHRVIVVAHSQGNLFANDAVESVIGDDPSFDPSIGIVGVASPAARTIQENEYFTAHDDRVIDGLRVLREVLPSNVENDPGIFNDHRDWLNHDFALSYMDGRLVSRGLIDAAVLDLAARLEFPTPELGDGAIRVTLEWGAEPDVDLHVFEPGGTHVYYQQLIGQNGFLDRDDITSFGPEHYFVACEDLTPGDYTIGVNYFTGSGPETARVQISTADGRTVSLTQELTNAVGSSGDATPIIIANVAVTSEEDGQFSFLIE